MGSLSHLSLIFQTHSKHLAGSVQKCILNRGEKLNAINLSINLAAGLF